MKRQFPILLILVATLAACSKKEPAAATGTPAPAPAATSIESTTAAETPPPPAAAPATAETAPAANNPDITDKLPTAPDNSSLATGAVNEPLTLALHRYVENTSKMPQTFQDLVKAKYIDKLPTPPPGKTFAIDRRHLQVVVVPK